MFTYVGSILDDGNFVYSIVIRMYLHSLDNGFIDAIITWNDGERVNVTDEKVDYNMLMNKPNLFATTYLVEEAH
jgi:hypothetical protein